MKQQKHGQEYATKGGLQTIAVGIPAYNEEQNIGKLLRAILSQRTPSDMRITEIFVVSDSSTDGTESVVRTIIDQRVQLIIHRKRQGLSVTLNEISARATADILILLDADVIPVNEDLVTELVQPMLVDEHVGLVGAAVEPVPPQSFFEATVAHGHYMKTDVYEHIRGGDTIYLCHGRARALRHGLYRILERPESCPEDSYSYLACKQAGLRFVYAPRARVQFYSPKNIHDHALQSRRFISGRQLLTRIFPLPDVQIAFHIPFLMALSRIARHFFWKPLHTLAYLVVLGWMMLTAPFTRIDHVRWVMSETSKS